MTYAESESVEAGLRFKSPSNILIETTGSTTRIDVHNMYVHEVVILEGPGEGEKFLLNLDAATPE